MANKKTKDELIKSHALLHALGKAQSSYISDTEPNDLFDKLLGKLLKITESEYGFIGQVLRNDKGEPYLQNFATTNISWNKETREFYEKYKDTGLEFSNMDSLFGLVITSGAPVISNDPSTDKRGCGIPEGHPPLNAFLGLPCYMNDKLVGMVAIANRPGGYDEEVIELLSPLLSTTANIIEAFRNDIRRREAEESLQNYKIIFDNMTDIAYMLDNEGLILYLNEPFEKLSGFKVEEFVGRSFAPLFEGKDLERAMEAFKKTIGGEALTFELEFKESGIVCEYTSMPLKDLEGRIIGALGTARDVTEKRLADEKLRKSEERFRDIAENANVWIWEADFEGRYTYASPMVEKILGYKPEEVVGRYFHEFVEPVERDIIKEKLNTVFDSKKSFLNVITSKIHKAGDTIFCETSGVPILDYDGKLVGYRGSVSDITERKKAEKALAVHARRLDRLSELGMMLSGDPGEVFERIVQLIGELLDVRVVCLSEIRGEELYFLSVYTDGETFVDAGHCPLEVTPCATVEEGKELRIYDHVMDKFPKAAFLKDYKAYSYCGFPSLDNDGNVVAVTCLLDDKPHEFSEEDQRLLRVFGQRIAMELDRSKVMAEKMKSEALLQSVLDNSTTVVYVKDMDGRYLLINSIFEELFHIKREAVLGKCDHDIFPKDLADAFRANDLKVLEAGEPIEFEEVAPHDDGPHTYISVKFPLNDNKGNPYAVCGISTDITDRTLMEADRLKMQKLESIGVLAGGIAHDFNNLLTGILGNISLAMMGLDPDDKTYKRLKEAEKASFFARDLTQQLLTFSKGGAPVKETFPIEELIKEPAELALRGSAKRCVFEITDGLPSVDVDKGQIGQVINNLVINADQAMPEGGVINISAEKETIDTNDHLPLRDGDYIVVRVADEGTGIPPEHIAKVFDPYFTTKQKGSGLGLASVYSIIKNHAGHIDLTSEIGKGTTFNIYLPVSKTAAARAIKEDEEIIKGHGRILIMDDEEIIRELLGEFLAQLGYETESASDGLEAVNIYKEARDGGRPFKAVIMDLTIQGGVGGKEAIKLLLKEDPEARAIVSSGYSNDPVVANYRDYGFSGYLNKPYKVMMLSKVLDTVINSRKE